jgi:uracil-DNA glycosylase
MDGNWAHLKTLARDEAAKGEMTIDLEAYEALGRDPLDPLIGGGNERAAIGFFGRDPGREEIRWMEPLIGSAGKLVRGGVHRWCRGTSPADFEAERQMSSQVFFSNTVPYKPLGNKAWPMAVKRRFHAVIASYLVDHWRGQELITLGNVAFHWFGIEASRDERRELKAFWGREDRYEATYERTLSSPLTGCSKLIRLHPLPHPSPLNAIWYPRFPGLLDARLRALSG